MEIKKIIDLDQVPHAKIQKSKGFLIAIDSSFEVWLLLYRNIIQVWNLEDAMILPVTAMYAGVCGLIVTWLAMRIVSMRRSEKIGLGHGENRRLERWIRAHANAVENIPILLFLLAMLELYKVPGWSLHLAGGVLVASRLLHGFGLGQRTVSMSRFLGATLNFVLLAVLSLAVIVLFFWSR